MLSWKEPIRMIQTNSWPCTPQESHHVSDSVVQTPLELSGLVLSPLSWGAVSALNHPPGEKPFPTPFEAGLCDESSFGNVSSADLVLSSCSAPLLSPPHEWPPHHTRGENNFPLQFSGIKDVRNHCPKLKRYNKYYQLQKSINIVLTEQFSHIVVLDIIVQLC